MTADARLRPDHPTVPVYCPMFGAEVPIDVEMAGVVAAIWARGWFTMSCCQDLEGEAYVGFDNVADAMAFVTAFGPVDDDPEELGWRVVVWWDAAWHAQVYFPPEEVAGVTRRMQR